MGRSRILNGTFSLHEMEDVETWCSHIIRRTNLVLTDQDREDLLTYLIETAWQLSLTYQHGDPRFPTRFSVYAGGILPLRITDWRRQRWGRTTWQWNGNTYRRRAPILVSLDEPYHYVDQNADDSVSRPELGGSFLIQPLDDTPPSSPDLMRLLRTGARPTEPPDSG